MNSEFLTLAVKAIESTDPNGEFEAILSTETLDRQGESIAAKAFDPLPESLPVYYEHDWRSGALPVAKAVPFYDGQVLKAKGVFAGTERGQEVRSLITEGFVGAMSVGFLYEKPKKVNGKALITKGDLFEASFTAIPVNPTARILAAKAIGAKAGARNSASDQQMIQQMHDTAVMLGADCTGATKSLQTKSLYPAVVPGSYEERIAAVRDALQEMYATDNEDTTAWVDVYATTDADVVYCVSSAGGTDETYRASYDWNDGEPTIGTPETVDVTAQVNVEPSDTEATAAATRSVAAAAAEDEENVELELRARLLAIDALTSA